MKTKLTEEIAAEIGTWAASMPSIYARSVAQIKPVGIHAHLVMPDIAPARSIMAYLIGCNDPEITRLLTEDQINTFFVIVEDARMKWVEACEKTEGKMLYAALNQSAAYL